MTFAEARAQNPGYNTCGVCGLTDHQVLATNEHRDAAGCILALKLELLQSQQRRAHLRNVLDAIIDTAKLFQRCEPQ